MMNKLIFSIIFGLGVLLSNIAEAKPLTMDQALEAVCRISTSGARGSGTVFGEDKDKYFILKLLKFKTKLLPNLKYPVKKTAIKNPTKYPIVGPVK